MADPMIRNIQRRIFEAGYPTMQAFAAHSGIRSDTLSKWIQGKSRPSKKSLEKLAAVLECSVEDLIRDEGRQASDADKDRSIEKLKKLVELQQSLIEKLERMLDLRK